MCDVNPMTQAKQQRCIFSWRNKNTASLGGWKSKIKVSAGLISWSLSPWFVDSRLLLPGSPRGFPAAHVCVLTTCDKDTSRPGVGVAQMISLYLSSLCQGPISKCTHILRNWGFGLEHTNFGGDTIQPTAVPHPYLLTLTTWVHLSPLFFFFGHIMWYVELSQPRIKPVPPAVEVESLNHWTTREVPQSSP